MTESIQTYSNDALGVTVRTVDDAGQVMFCAKDVAAALGYSNHNDAVKRHCKGVVKRYPLQTSGGVQEVGFIAEPDLYRLITGSKLPSAQRFEAWVFEEVLPAIRRNGGYMAAAPDEDPEAIMARALLVARDTMERQRARIDRLSAANDEMAPKAGFFDACMDDGVWMTFTEASRLLHQYDPSMTRTRLFDLATRDGIITVGHQASRYGIDRGYVRNYQPPARYNQRTGELYPPKPYAKITGKGLRWMLKRYCSHVGGAL
ncbi:BRO family protein [Caniella muris]|uniref:BRO family protein n=1 Tax=Caniella muris TaxID=2941502 RepID=UPI002040E7E3|nr:BRO family protein [Caniella muris]